MLANARSQRGRWASLRAERLAGNRQTGAGFRLAIGWLL
jgi:hypothetical protein